MLCMIQCHVSNHGMRCLQYIPVAQLYGGVFTPLLFNTIHLMLTTYSIHKSFFSRKDCFWEILTVAMLSISMLFLGDDRRRGPGVCFSEATTNKPFPKALIRSERPRIVDAACYLYTKIELPGRTSSPRTPYSVPRDNP